MPRRRERKKKERKKDFKTLFDSFLRQRASTRALHSSSKPAAEEICVSA